MEAPGAYRAETTNSAENKRKHKKKQSLCCFTCRRSNDIFVCVLPAVPHYQAALCSSSGERQLWIPLLISEAILHLLLAAAEKNPTSSGHVQATTHKLNN